MYNRYGLIGIFAIISLILSNITRISLVQHLVDIKNLIYYHIYQIYLRLFYI